MPRQVQCETSLGATLPRSVLIVDDNVDAGDMLADVLRAFSVAVRVARDAPEALAILKTDRFDVALLDIGLPVIDGHELAGLIRGNPEHDDMKLVALSGYGQEGDKRRSRESGFLDHLVKPVDIEVLRLTLGRL